MRETGLDDTGEPMRSLTFRHIIDSPALAQIRETIRRLLDPLVDEERREVWAALGAPVFEPSRCRVCHGPTTHEGELFVIGQERRGPFCSEGCLVEHFKANVDEAARR